jgi:predicted SprT family Zn-dependent metalloprotease
MVASKKDLEVHVLRALLRSWHHLNEAHFSSLLRAPVLQLTDSESYLGRWTPQSRTLSLSRSLLFEHAWGIVLEVMKHEMAHQYVNEVLYLFEETPHGPAFQQLCQRLGIDSAAAGLPTARSNVPAPHPVLEKVAKLLALAESSNEHEAQAAMKAAQRLMLRYNLDRGPTATAQDPYGFRHVGKATGRVQAWERLLASLLVDHFFVEAIWVPSYRPLEGKYGTVLELCGTEANLDLASYVYDFLTHTAMHLWHHYRKTIVSSGTAGRLSFFAGVIRGFEETLRRSASESKAQGLVWIQDPKLPAYVRTRHPRVRTIRYGTGTPSIGP